MRNIKLTNQKMRMRNIKLTNQKMRMRNNEASKRCRLKRRIKQDSLDKTLLLLDRHNNVIFLLFLKIILKTLISRKRKGKKELKR